MARQYFYRNVNAVKETHVTEEHSAQKQLIEQIRFPFPAKVACLASCADAGGSKNGRREMQVNEGKTARDLSRISWSLDKMKRKLTGALPRVQQTQVAGPAAYAYV